MMISETYFFEISKYITHPISLVAFVSALITYYFISKNINERKKLEANPVAYQKTAERLNIDLKLIPEPDRAVTILKVLKIRVYSLLITAISFIVGGFIIAYIFINYIQTNADKQKEINEKQREQNTMDSMTAQLQQESIIEPAVIRVENKSEPNKGKEINSASDREIENKICAAKAYLENQQYNEAINIYESIRAHSPIYCNSYDLEEIDNFLNKKDIEKASKAYLNLFSNYKCK